MQHKIIPNDDNILVQLVSGDEKIGSIIIPEKARDNHRDAVIAKVIAVGPGRATEQGAFIKVTVGVGELVLIPRVNGYKLETDGKVHQRIMRCTEVLAKLEESRVITLDTKVIA